MKKLSLAIIMFVFALSNASFSMTIDELFPKLQESKNKIKDMQAEITTSITSNVKGMKNMEQKGRIWTKGADKSKTEMLSPMKQTTILNGSKMAMISPDTGEKRIQDLSKVKGYEGGQGGQMDFEKAKEKFNFSVKDSSGGYLITGTPRDNNKFMGKMEIFVDSGKMAPTKISIYNPAGKIINTTTIEYRQVSGINIAYKNVSSVNLPNGSMKVEMVYDNIKVNSGISDSVFDI